MPARRIIVAGLVQGVFYRAHTQEKANELGIVGWANNRPDGSVEIHAEGSREVLVQFEQWCRDGPPAAHVESVQSEEGTEHHYDAFEIIR